MKRFLTVDNIILTVAIFTFLSLIDYYYSEGSYFVINVISTIIVMYYIDKFTLKFHKKREAKKKKLNDVTKIDTK